MADIKSDNFDNELNNIWEELKEGLDCIYERRGLTGRQYMNLYTQIFNYIGREHKGCPLRQKLKELIRGFLRQYLTKLIEEMETTIAEEVLNLYSCHWEAYLSCSKVLNNICAYFNRYVRIPEYDIYQHALVVWKECVFLRFHNKVTNAVLELIHRERNGEIIETTSVVSTAVRSYAELGLDVHEPEIKTEKQRKIILKQQEQHQFNTYQAYFESHYLKQTENFYAKESLSLWQEHSITEYVEMAEQRLREEEKRAKLYLNGSSLKGSMETCTTILIRQHLEALQDEFKRLLYCEDNEGLAKMHSLMARQYDALVGICNEFETLVCTKGMSALEEVCENGRDNPKLYVSTIIDVHRKYTHIVQNTFKNDFMFAAALDKACVNFINTNAVTKNANNTEKSPELVAEYCDQLLNKSNKNFEDIEDTLTHIMTVFKYLEDKDVFQKFYSVKLAKRLVSHLSGSDEAESYMITLLKHACGSYYTSKLQRMYQDVGLSKDLNNEFRSYLEDKKGALKFEFEIQVLSSGSWPFTQFVEFGLPAELEQSTNKFTEFYNTKHCGRKLIWLHNLSNGNIVANCYRKSYMFKASAFQMAVLLMFNSSDSYLVRELAEDTKLKIDILVQVVLSLLKVGLLAAPKGDNVDNLTDDTKISFSRKYTSKKLCVNINAPLQTEVQQEQEKTHKIIEEDRKFVIQAAIIRIMKMRKVCGHQELVAEVFSQLSNRFSPRVESVEKFIDTLIDKEYLVRNTGQKKMYSYLA